jgi:hypothetical protein
MKKCFLNVTTVMCTLLAMASFVGCSNDDTIVPKGGEVETKSVILKLDLSNNGDTRAVSANDVDEGTAISIADGVNLVFYDENGLITYATTLNAANYALAVTPGDHVVANVPTNSKYIAVTAINHYTPDNSHDSFGETFFDFAATPNHAIPTVSYTGQTLQTNINIYGSDEIDTTSDPYVAEVTLAPTVARFEIMNAIAGTDLTSFDIIGVFLDDFYQTATIDGAFNSSLSEASHDPDDYAANTTKYPTADATKTYDIDFNTAGGGATDPWSVTTSGTTPLSGIVSYYAFAGPYSSSFAHNSIPTNGNNTPPTIVLKINNVIVSNSMQDFYTGNTYYVTIKGFKYSTGTLDVNSIAGGYIYRIPVGGLTINRTHLQTAPHVEPITTELTIAPITWKNVDVSPVL